MGNDYRRQVIALARTSGAIRPKDLAMRGIPRSYLYALHAEGAVKRSSRGIYWYAKGKITQHHSLVEVTRRVPQSIISLISALRFHELTTQNPYHVWIAVPPNARKPNLKSPALRIVRFSGKALTEGIEAHRLEGVDVRIYSAAKTVADCFKYRNKIGIDVAIEALKDALRLRKATFAQIAHFATLCRVSKVMRPYVEAVQ